MRFAPNLVYRLRKSMLAIDFSVKATFAQNSWLKLFDAVGKIRRLRSFANF